jgi:glycerol-3-phosphate dehydrogenase
MFSFFSRYLPKPLFITSAITTTTTAYAFCISQADANTNDTCIYDCLVIGGGVVGLSVGRELAVRGHSTILVEKNDSICTGASSGNSGIGCTGYDAPEGSLERLLLRRSILRHPHLYRSLGLSYNHVRKCGALVVAWSPEELNKLNDVLQENHDAGDTESRIVSKEEMFEIEPALNRSAKGAVWVPREMVTEPWLVPIAYANSMLENGGEILLQSKVCDAKLNDLTKIWKVKMSNGQIIHTRSIFNCAGLYGDLIDRLGVGQSKFCIKPRKGQFVVYSPILNDSMSPDVIIQPVPTLRTKGVIVWKSVYGNIIVGPTAEEQNNRDDRSNDNYTINKLSSFGLNVLPELKNCHQVGTYSGIRPATEHRDYQIHHVRGKQWITVGGIRSTGLTCASGISEYVVDMYEKEVLKGCNCDDESFQPPTTPVRPPYLPSLQLQHPQAIPNPAAPDLQTLSSDFYGRNDGHVYCFGRLWKVTHPLSSIGMNTLGRKRMPKRRKNETLREYKIRREQWQKRKISEQKMEKKGSVERVDQLERVEKKSKVMGANGVDAGFRKFSKNQLSKFNGDNPSKPILLAVFGDVFDVSFGGENGEPSMYGVGSGYHALAGKACTRALALMSVASKDIDKGDDLSGLSKEDIESAQSWHRFMLKKYKVVGKYVSE